MLRLLLCRVVANPRFILQAVTDANHADAVTALLQLADANRVLISVAYLREDGLAALEAAIRPLVANTEVFVGIRNDLTSIQAVKRLLALGVRLFAVDTATRQSIYPPKLYFVSSDTVAGVVIGSANMTFGGMYNNIEVSAAMTLDLSNAEDKKFIDDVTAAFVDLAGNHPDHVFNIKDAAHADDLFAEGRLADETVIPPPSTGSTNKKGGTRDLLRPMNLNLKRKPKPKIAPVPAPPPAPGAAVIVAPAAQLPAPVVSQLVWVSKPLKRRDLNIPTAPGTNPTGSMGWKKGTFEDIDQRHYFRDEVFKLLRWQPDPRRGKGHLERAAANFELHIKGVNYGRFNLRLSHNTDRTSAGYIQNNFMTEIHWGDAKEHVAKEDLLGRTLYLYRKDTDPPEFVIEID